MSQHFPPESAVWPVPSPAAAIAPPLAEEGELFSEPEAPGLDFLVSRSSEAWREIPF